MEMIYTFFYDLYDGTRCSDSYRLNENELAEMCEKYDNNSDIIWWNYDESEEEK